MNDLYLTSYVPDPNDYDPVECNKCDEPLSFDQVVVLETLDSAEPVCNACAEKTAKKYKGTVHDRREDAEALLSEILKRLNAHPDAHVRDFIPRLARR